MLELALWKARIHENDEVIIANEREAYRIEVPGPVKDLVLQYLGYESRALKLSEEKISRDAVCPYLNVAEQKYHLQFASSLGKVIFILLASTVVHFNCGVSELCFQLCKDLVNRHHTS